MTYEPFPPAVREMLRAYHEGTVEESDCARCASRCCLLGGLGILENVLLAYEAYCQGSLRREDYVFPRGLSLRAFVSLYFDASFYPSERQARLVLFRTRPLSQDGRVLPWSLVAGPAAGPARGESGESRLSFGCVFLSSRLQDRYEDDGQVSRGCLLHAPESGRFLTAKPIHCVFHTCVRLREPKYPVGKQLWEWNDRLADAYPGSPERFRALLNGPE